MSGAGTSSQQQQQTQVSNPWGPTQAPLQNILSGIGQQPLGPTPGQTGAANNLVAGANAIPNMGPSVANTIGGYLNPNFTNPYSNPALQQSFNTLNQQIGNSVEGQFSGAGRPGSNGQVSKAIAQGEANAEAPTLANLYTQLLGLQQGGIGQIPSIAQSYLTPGTAQLGAATQQAQLPLANTLAAESGVLPIAGLGGQVNSQGGTQYNPSMLSQINQGILGAGMLFG